MTTHTHKAIKAKSQTSGWTHCVDANRCAANPRRQDAHGNIEYTDHCSCGAVRKGESNGGKVNYGSWAEVGE